MGLIRMIFWLAIFLGATFVFTVLFEHGPMNFAENSKREWMSITKLAGSDVKRKDDGTDKLLK